MKTGLTSVTFRQKSTDEIIAIAKAAGLMGIEWGGDVHVPAGDLDTANSVREKCAAAGLSVLSYGSYYKALEGQDFAPVLASAKALGAPIIRIWTGDKNPDQQDEAGFSALVKNISEAADMAAKAGIFVAFEYHRGTMTQTKEGAYRLLTALNHPNIRTYWQPNPDVTFEEQLSEIALLKEWICCYHVFAWEVGNVRYPLSHGADKWAKYIEAIGVKEPNLVLEFIKDDADEVFLADAATLHQLNKGATDMNKPNAVFLCNGDKIYDVYDSATLEKLDAQFQLSRVVVTDQTLEEHKTLLQNADYIFSTWGMPHMTHEQIDSYLPNVKAVFYGAGSVQGFAKEFLEKGRKVFSAWGANAVPVAEYTLAQIILAGKGFYQCVERYGRLGREAARVFTNAQPCNYNIKVGILGAGMIGRMVIERLVPFSYEVLVYDPFVSDEVLAQYGAKRADLATIFSECQIISNHIANLPATVGMLKYEHFSAMKKNATFINTGRGAQIVEADMIKALIEEPDRTAVLDVTFPEPPEADSPLNTLPNVVLTPHIAGSMNNEVARMGEYMQVEAEKLLNGTPCQYEVSLKMLETMA